jgi:hypothetical protein
VQVACPAVSPLPAPSANHRTDTIDQIDNSDRTTPVQQAPREAARNLRPRYAPVAALGSRSFADLDVVETIEKSVLATCDRASGSSTDEQIRRFGRAVGRRHARFAFPDDLTRTLSRLTDRIKSKHGRASVEGRLLEQLEEIRVTASPHWPADRVDVSCISYSQPILRFRVKSRKSLIGCSRTG